MSNQLCELLGVEFPIILGGMMFVGRPPLVAAVSQAGGLGILGAGRMSPPELHEAVAQIRRLTDRPFGVNLPLRSPEVEHLVGVVVKEGVPVVSTSAGDPGLYTRGLQEGGIKVLHVVATVAQARKAQEAGVDAIVAEGCESGGFLGKDQVSTLALVPQVVDAVQVPVVAAGGIADGRGLVAALALGAQGVQLGTRFLAATECCLPPEYKLAIVMAQDTDTLIAANASGARRRTLKTALVRAAAQVLSQPVSQLLQGYGPLGQHDSQPSAYAAGRGYSAGQGAGLIHKVQPVEEIMRHLVEQARLVAKALPAFAI